jgi:hypothetical protein
MRPRAPLARIIVAATLMSGCGVVTTGHAPMVQPPTALDPVGADQAPSPASPQWSCDGRGDPDRAGEPTQDRPGVTEPSSIPATFDTRHGVIVAVDTVAFPGETSVTWTFDVCTNAWTRRSPPVGPEGDLYHFVYDEAADVTLAVPHWTGPMWAYSVTDDAWTRLPESSGRPEGITDATYDPDRAKVMAWSDFDGALFQYDLASNTWTRVEPLPSARGVLSPAPSRRDIDGGTLWYSLLAYDTVADDLILAMLPVAGVPGATWVFHPDSWSWTKADQEPPLLNLGWGEFGTEVAFDSAHRAVVIDALGFLATYASANGTWSLPEPTSWAPGLTLDPRTFEVTVNGERVRRHLTRGPLARSWPTLVYDPVNERIIMLGGTATIVDPTTPLEEQWTSWILADVWAYDVGANRWTQLLAPHDPPVMSGHYTE